MERELHEEKVVLEDLGKCSVEGCHNQSVNTTMCKKHEEEADEEYWRTWRERNGR